MRKLCLILIALCLLPACASVSSDGGSPSQHATELSEISSSSAPTQGAEEETRFTVSGKTEGEAEIPIAYKYYPPSEDFINTIKQCEFLTPHYISMQGIHYTKDALAMIQCDNDYLLYDTGGVRYYKTDGTDSGLLFDASLSITAVDDTETLFLTDGLDIYRFHLLTGVLEKTDIDYKTLRGIDLNRVPGVKSFFTSKDTVYFTSHSDKNLHSMDCNGENPSVFPYEIGDPLSLAVSGNMLIYQETEQHFIIVDLHDGSPIREIIVPDINEQHIVTSRVFYDKDCFLFSFDDDMGFGTIFYIPYLEGQMTILVQDIMLFNYAIIDEWFYFIGRTQDSIFGGERGRFDLQWDRSKLARIPLTGGEVEWLD